MQYPTNRIVLTTAFVKQLWKKCCGMCYSACGMVHIKDTLLLIRKSNQSSGSSGFPLSLPEWSFTIYLMQRTVNVLRVLLNKTFPSFIIIPFVGQNLFITLHTILHYTHRCIIYIYINIFLTVTHTFQDLSYVGGQLRDKTWPPQQHPLHYLPSLTCQGQPQNIGQHQSLRHR